jgi:hypothetical protein
MARCRVTPLLEGSVAAEVEEEVEVAAAAEDESDCDLFLYPLRALSLTPPLILIPIIVVGTALLSGPNPRPVSSRTGRNNRSASYTHSCPSRAAE